MVTGAGGGAPRTWAEAEAMPKVIGIRYCGGCNPRYDRVAQVRRMLQEPLPFQFAAVRPGGTYAAVLLICGCETACVTVTDLPPVPLLYVRSAQETEQVLRVLCEH